MNYSKCFLFVGLLFLLNSVRANDSTLIYNERIQKLKSLHAWLSVRPTNQLLFPIDKTSAGWRTYDTAISVFFDSHFIDSIFSINTNHFAVSEKFEPTKLGIDIFENLCMKFTFDSLKFKMQESFDKIIEIPKSELRNSIVLYLIFKGKEYSLISFRFRENSSILISAMSVFSLSREGSDEINKVVNYLKGLNPK